MSGRVLQAWAGTVRRGGGAPAVIEAAGGATVTFRELAARAEQWRAQHVTDRARVAGRAVVFSAPNGIAWFEIFLGLLGAGAVAVPLDAGEPAAARRGVATRIRAGFIWDGTGLEPLPKPRACRNREIILMKLTSGSTGEPRPLPFTGAQMLADMRQIATTMGIDRRDRNYALVPFSHSYGLGSLVFLLLGLGVPVVCGSAPLPHAISADFARWRPTVFPGVPVLWRALALLAPDPAALASLRLGISAGAPLAPEIARAFTRRFHRRLHAFYGSSETGGISYDRTGLATLAGGVGRALNGVKLGIARGQRLQVSSAAVTTGGRGGRRGRFLMPDRVELDPAGGLTLLGRRGSTVKISGRRVNLVEVAARLRRLAGVSDVWVAAGTGEDPMLGAAVATERTAADLRAELQSDTPAWRIPKRLLALPVFPVTARGKPDPRALREMVFGAG